MKPHLQMGAPSFKLCWLAFSVILAVSYLLPTHEAPWSTFYPQIVAAGSFAWLGWCLSLSWRRVSFDLPFFVMLGIALIPGIQVVLGFFTLPDEAILLSIYLLGLPGVYLMARQSALTNSLQCADYIFLALTFAGLISSAMALIQWLHLDVGGVMIMHAFDDGRAMANVGQPNMLSTLLVWALVGGWWLCTRGHIRPWIFAATGLVIIVAAASSQSRTGILQMISLACLAIWISCKFRTSRTQAVLPVLLVTCFLVLSACWPALNILMNEVPPRDMQAMFKVGERAQIYSMMIAAIWDSPLWGYGWNQGLQAYLGQIGNFPPLKNVVGDSHNLALDLILWVGLPLGLFLVAIQLGFLCWLARRIKTQEDALLLGAIVVFFCHAMTELPHAYATFSLPVTALLGCLAAGKTRETVSASWEWFLGYCSVSLVVLAVLVSDYREIEKDLFAYRLRSAKIGKLLPVEAPKPILLGYLYHSLNVIRQRPEQIVGEAAYNDLRRVVQRYPSFPGLKLLARVEALRGNAEQEENVREKICKLYRDSICKLGRVDSNAGEVGSFIFEGGK